METININTGLDDFIMLDQISCADNLKIKAEKSFYNAHIFCAIETLAQLGAMHVRFLTSFEKHAFLLKVNSFKFNESSDLGNGIFKGIFNGTFKLNGLLKSHGKDAFAYDLSGTQDDQTKFYGIFLFGTVNYDENFKSTILKEHYQKVFSCLQNGLKIN